MTKPTLTLLCLAGATSLAFGNLQPVSPPKGGKIPFRPGPHISQNHHVFQEDTQTDQDSYDVFYDQLADDGQWYYDDTYGYVFQPSDAVSSSDWRPYSDGHWEDTDRGWYWDSNERYGWATYHYGRWVLVDGEGWVWVPGNEWAPAWVSWRDSEDYVGWAPLPPDCGSISVGISVGGWCDSYWGIGPSWYCFLPYHSWFAPSYVGAFAPFNQNVAIINRTRNVTNIYNNNTVINNFGPQAQQIALKTNRQVTKYNVNYMAQTDPRAFKTAKNGNQLSVVGPKPTLKTVATKPPNVAKTLTGTKVNKGWNNVNGTEATSLKNKFAQQNPVPGNLPKTTNALVKPTILGSKVAGVNKAIGGNTPGGNKGVGTVGNNAIASNKGAGNGVLANPNNANAGGANNKGVGSNNLKAFKETANPSNTKGANGTGGNPAVSVNNGAGSNNAKAFKETANTPNTKGAKGTGGGNTTVAGNKGTGSNQLKSFKSTTNKSTSKGAQGAGGGNYTQPKTLKKAATGETTHHTASTYHPTTKAYHPSASTYHPSASTYHPSAAAYHPPAAAYHPPAAAYHPPAAAYHPPAAAYHPPAAAYHPPAAAYHPPAAAHPPASHPSGGGNKGGGGGGNKKDEKKK
jgi:hypothetical protein